MLTVFKENGVWIWENLDNLTINNLLKEYHEMHRSPEEKKQTEMEDILNKQIEENPMVKAFMSGEINIGNQEK